MRLKEDDSGNVVGLVDNNTVKPDKVLVYKSICFNYNNINYSITSDDASQINDDTINFAKEYIKYLKNTN